MIRNKKGEMKTEEKLCLVNEKVREGKTKEVAWEEVNRDILFLRNLKQRIKDEEMELKNNLKQKKNLNEKFKKEFKKLIEREEKEKEVGKGNNSRVRVANTIQLKRILSFIPNKFTSITNISKIVCANYSQTKDGLKFLTKNGLIREKEGGYCRI